MRPMPNADPAPAAVLRGPADAVAALPHLLGFIPDESLVAIWIRHDAVALTQRLDLAGLEDTAQAARHIVATAGAAKPESVLLILCTSLGSAQSADQPFATLVEAVGSAAQDAGVEVLDALLTDGGRYWSYRCAGPCCPPQGAAVAVGDRARIARAFGVPAPSARRADLVAGWGRDHEAASRVEPLVEEWESDLRAHLLHAAQVAREAALETWRDEQIECIESVLSGGEGVDGNVLARLLVALGDVRVRDTVVWERAQAAAGEAARPILIEALRAAPPGYVAPVATVLALTCWQSGDGALASMALDRALEDDPDYRLALLAAKSIGAGIPPGAWRELIQGMAREQCRGGEDPGSRAASASV